LPKRDQRGGKNKKVKKMKKKQKSFFGTQPKVALWLLRLIRILYLQENMSYRFYYVICLFYKLFSEKKSIVMK